MAFGKTVQIALVLLAVTLTACNDSDSKSSQPTQVNPAELPQLVVSSAIARQQQILLRGTAVDADGIERIDVTIDNIPFEIENTEFWAFNSPSLDTGEHRVSVQATDSMGLRSAEASFTVDVTGPSTLPACSRYAAPELTGLMPEGITESSGLTVSAFDEQVLWTHNDSGGSARVFAINTAGELLATVTLTDSEGGEIEARDFEDIASGPCFDGDLARSCLYVGDIGDNAHVHESIRIHRFVEPDPSLGDQTVSVESMHAQYSEGATDAETLMVDNEGAVIIVNKVIGEYRVYGAPFQANTEPTVLPLLSGGTALNEQGGPTFEGLRADFFTGGDYQPQRNFVVLRGYFGTYEFRLPSAQSASDIGAASFTVVPSPDGTQIAEAIAYGTEGYWTNGEGEAAELYFVSCLDEE